MALNSAERRIIADMAKALNIPADFAIGVVSKESAGNVLWNVQGAMLPAIRIEGHYFYRHLRHNPVKQLQAVNSGLAAKSSGVVKNPDSYAARYAMLDRMAKIDPVAAYNSISIGIGQVMGEHAVLLGFKDSVDMWQQARRGLTAQADQMLRFIAKHPNLLRAANRYDYVTFAKGYNGPGYKKNRYDTELAKYVAAAKRALADPAVGHVVVSTDITGGVWLERIVKLGYTDARAFQTAHGLNADGKIGPITREKIVEAEKAKAAPVVTAATVGTSATGVAGVAWLFETYGKHADSIKSALETIGSWSPTTLVIVGSAVAVSAAGYGIYKWFSR